ncbi:MAG: MarR family transcriptional regulator [Saprospiraceae bacterium]|nr:MarR family transcriptional regulator [Saprospiraceae bacterium]
MRNEYNQLIELIRQWGIFEKEAELADLETFAVWVLKNKSSFNGHPNGNGNGHENHRNGKTNGNGNGHPEHLHALATNINWQLLRLARYSELYMKAFFKDEKISFNEFRVLAVLAQHTLLKKNEVINENLFETTTGTTIIKNLVEKNYLEEVEDANDKRIKRVRFSPLGRVLYDDINGRFSKINLLITANLSDHEKGSLSSSLGYLDNFHAKIYTQLKQETLNNLLEQYVFSNNGVEH